MRVLADILNEGLLGRQSHRITIKDTVDVLAGDIMSGDERAAIEGIKNLHDLLSKSADAYEASEKKYKQKEWGDTLFIMFRESKGRPLGTYMSMVLPWHLGEPDGVYSVIDLGSSSGPYNVYPDETYLSWVGMTAPRTRLIIGKKPERTVYAVKKGSELYDALSDMIIKFYDHKWR